MFMKLVDVLLHLIPQCLKHFQALGQGLVVLPLFFVAWAFSLGRLIESDTGAWSVVIGFAYPIVDALVLTIVVTLISRLGVTLRLPTYLLLIGLDLEGIAVSSGSACSSGTLEPSHVLKAMGLPHLRTLSSIRFSLGSANTEDEVDRVITVLPPLVEKLRSLTTVGARR